MCCCADLSESNTAQLFFFLLSTEDVKTGSFGFLFVSFAAYSLRNNRLR